MEDIGNRDDSDGDQRAVRARHGVTVAESRSTRFVPDPSDRTSLPTRAAAPRRRGFSARLKQRRDVSQPPVLRPPMGIAAASVFGMVAAIFYTIANIALRFCVGVDPFLVSAVQGSPDGSADGTLPGLDAVSGRNDRHELEDAAEIHRGGSGCTDRRQRRLSSCLGHHRAGGLRSHYAWRVDHWWCSAGPNHSSRTGAAADRGRHHHPDRRRHRVVPSRSDRVAFRVSDIVSDMGGRPMRGCFGCGVRVIRGSDATGADRGLSVPATMFTSGVVGTVVLWSITFSRIGVGSLDLITAEQWGTMFAAGACNFTAFVALSVH